MMLARGSSSVTIRSKGGPQKFGQTYANGLRHRQPRRGDNWHLDEVFLTINGKRQYLWRAIDQDGNVLAILATSRRDARAAKRFSRKLLTGLRYVLRGWSPTSWPSYGVACRACSERGASLIEVSGQPGREHPPAHRQRQRAMKRFRSAGGAQRFLSCFSARSPHFRPHRHRLTAAQYRHEMNTRFTT